MSSIEQWVEVTRGDREIVGYLEPVTEDYGLVQPRSLLGHAVGAPTGFMDGEERLLEGGIGELAEEWTLDAGSAAEVAGLAIVEVSPQSIVVADRLSSKALMAAETLHVRWPDLEHRLSRR